MWKVQHNFCKVWRPRQLPSPPKPKKGPAYTDKKCHSATVPHIWKVNSCVRYLKKLLQLFVSFFAARKLHFWTGPISILGCTFYPVDNIESPHMNCQLFVFVLVRLSALRMVLLLYLGFKDAPREDLQKILKKLLIKLLIVAFATFMEIFDKLRWSKRSGRIQKERWIDEQRTISVIGLHL